MYFILHILLSYFMFALHSVSIRLNFFLWIVKNSEITFIQLLLPSFIAFWLWRISFTFYTLFYNIRDYNFARLFFFFRLFSRYFGGVLFIFDSQFNENFPKRRITNMFVVQYSDIQRMVWMISCGHIKWNPTIYKWT